MELREYLFRARIKQVDFAKKLGLSRTHLALIVLKKRRPSPDLAKKIMEETGGRVTLIELLFPEVSNSPE